MTYHCIRYEVADGVATITLHRPDNLNALTVQMTYELVDVFDRVNADDDVRVVIVTGAGRAFCAGADVSAGEDAFKFEYAHPEPVERPDGTLDYSVENARDGGGLISLNIYRCLKPVIAAINGAAVGVGITMTLPMDIRLASQTARMGFVFARRGIVAEAASSWFLPRVVGIAQAMDWCVTGRVFSAEEALATGLVKALYPPDELLPAAYALAREIVDNTAPVSIALIRQMMWQGLGWSHPMDAHRIDSRGILAMGRSADVAEGVKAFLEKRPAAFPGKVSTDMPDYFPWWEEPAYS